MPTSDAPMSVTFHSRLPAAIGFLRYGVLRRGNCEPRGAEGPRLQRSRGRAIIEICKEAEPLPDEDRKWVMQMLASIYLDSTRPRG